MLGQIDERIQRARNWYYEKYYERKPTIDKEIFKSSYLFRPPQMASTDGEYVINYGNLKSEGQIGADVTYAIEGGERYYNPVSKKQERMPLSELIYQQMVDAKLTKSRIISYKSGHVAGEQGRKVVKQVRALTQSLNSQPIELFPTYKDAKAKCFLALLGSPNAVAALWLISDHGRELGIRAIRSITLTSGNSLVINFG